MRTVRRTWYVLLVPFAVSCAFLFTFLLAFRQVQPITDSAAIAVIVGAMAGALGAVLTGALTALVAVWSQSVTHSQQLRDRVSSHALELTRMDYELRIRALDESRESAEFLAPVKVYRELYRALLQLHEKNEWPLQIEQLGLLGIFQFDPARKVRLEDRRKQLALILEFLGKPASDFKVLQGAGNTWDEEWRRAKARPIQEWVERYRPLFPSDVQKALTGIANLAGTVVVGGGVELGLRLESFEAARGWMETLESYSAELRRESGEA